MPWSGRDQKCQWSPTASRCWEHLQVTLIVVPHLVRIKEEHRALLNEFQQCRMQLASSCSAQLPGRTICCVWCGLRWSESLSRTMMQGCGDVCARHCTFLKTSAKPRQDCQHNAPGARRDGTSECSEDQSAHGRDQVWPDPSLAKLG